MLPASVATDTARDDEADCSVAPLSTNALPTTSDVGSAVISSGGGDGDDDAGHADDDDDDDNSDNDDVDNVDNVDVVNNNKDNDVDVDDDGVPTTCDVGGATLANLFVDDGVVSALLAVGVAPIGVVVAVGVGVVVVTIEPLVRNGAPPTDDLMHILPFGPDVMLSGAVVNRES